MWGGTTMYDRITELAHRGRYAAGEAMAKRSLLLSLLLGYLYYLTRPAAYRSDARVMVINQTANMAPNSAEAYRDDGGEASGHDQVR